MRMTTSLVLLALSAVVACSPIGVQTDYDRKIDFSKYKRYKWLPPKQQPKNQVIADRIREAIEYRLGRKGFQKQEEVGKPDFLITYHGRITTKIDVVTTEYGYSHWHRSTMQKTSVYRYNEGTLVIDVIDAPTSQLIWRGVGVGAVTAASRNEMIDQAVDEILKQFPPGKK